MLHTENDIKVMTNQLKKRKEFFLSLEVKNEKQKKKVEKIINNIDILIRSLDIKEKDKENYNLILTGLNILKQFWKNASLIIYITFNTSPEMFTQVRYSYAVLL